MIIRTLLFDDRPAGRRELRRLLAKEPDFLVVAECASPADAIGAIALHGPHVIFVATDPAHPERLDALASLPIETRPLAVMVTSHPDHSLAAFEFGALDCLLQPIASARFHTTLERIRRQLSAIQPEAASDSAHALAPLKRFVVRGSDRLVVVETGQVDWMESASNYIVLHTGRETHVVRDTLARIEQRLPADRFLRVSRFAIVNLDRIREVQLASDGNHLVLLAGGDKVPLTRGVREIQERLESA